MMTPQEILLANEMELAVVAAVIAHAAGSRGGTMVASAAELHGIVSAPSPLWPRSALELDRRLLPTLARRPGHGGATVRPLGGMARGRWLVIAEPVARAVAPTSPALAGAGPVPPPPPAAADADAEPVVSEAEFQRVRAALAAAEEAHDEEERRRHLEKRRVARHEMNLARLDELGAAS